MKKRTTTNLQLKVSRFLDHQVNKCQHSIPLYRNFAIIITNRFLIVTFIIT